MFDELKFKAQYTFGVKFPITKVEFLKARKKLFFKYHGDKGSKSDSTRFSEVYNLAKEILANLDELNASPNVVTFSEEQIKYLTELLTPFCCHKVNCSVHKWHPLKQELCVEQMTEAYINLCHALGLNPKAKRRPGCSYCVDRE